MPTVGFLYGDYDFGVIATLNIARVMRHKLNFACLITYLAMFM